MIVIFSLRKIHTRESVCHSLDLFSTVLLVYWFAECCQIFHEKFFGQSTLLLDKISLQLISLQIIFNSSFAIGGSGFIWRMLSGEFREGSVAWTGRSDCEPIGLICQERGQRRDKRASNGTVESPQVGASEGNPPIPDEMLDWKQTGTSGLEKESGAATRDFPIVNLPILGHPLLLLKRFSQPWEL